jgi:cleavage and polyadenylation specificity factor subunit 3
MAEEGEVKKPKPDHASSIGQVISGVLVQNDFKLSLMAPEDLKEYAGLTTTTLLCRQRLTLGSASTELIKWALEGTFGTVDIQSPEAEPNGKHDDEEADAELSRPRPRPQIFSIMGDAVRVICKPRGEIELEWEGNATNDSIADAVMAILLTVESSPAAIKHSSVLHDHHSHSHSHSHSHPATTTTKPNGAPPTTRNPHSNLSPDERLNRLFMFLEAQFGEEAIAPIRTPPLPHEPSTSDGDGDGDAPPSTVDREKKEAHELARLHALGIPVPGLEIRVDKNVARVWLERLEVECANKTLADRVRAVVERAVDTVAPLWG